MLHQLQQLMGTVTAFSALEVTSVVVVAIVAGMVIGGLAGMTRNGATAGYSSTSRGRRTTRLATERTSGAALAGWAGVGLDAAFHGSGQWVDLSAAATYQGGGFPHTRSQIPSQPLRHTMVPTTMLPLAALPSAGQAPQSPVPLVAPQSPAFLLMAQQSPAAPPAGPQSDGSPLVELQPVAFLPGIYQATTYRLDVTGRADTDEQDQVRPLWRLGNALFSAARGRAVRAIAPPAGSPPTTAARPGRHRASQNKRVRRNDDWMRNR